MGKLSIESIKESLEGTGWKVCTQQYKNLSTEMLFTCPEGHEVYNTWGKLRNKLVCPICANNEYKNIINNDTPLQKKKNILRVLALDQATHISGFSIFDGDKLVKYGLYEVELDNEIARDHAVKIWMVNMIHNWQPDLVAIEGIQYQKEVGVTTFETLARLQGILMETCYELGVKYEICPTNTWRKYNKVKGRTRNDKKQSARQIVKDKYDITVTNDCADAILIGCYAADKYKSQIEIISWE